MPPKSTKRKITGPVTAKEVQINEYEPPRKLQKTSEFTKSAYLDSQGNPSFQKRLALPDENDSQPLPSYHLNKEQFSEQVCKIFEKSLIVHNKKCIYT